MEDGALTDLTSTTGMPTDMEEFASDSADQELTLGQLGSDKDALDQIELAIGPF